MLGTKSKPKSTTNTNNFNGSATPGSADSGATCVISEGTHVDGTISSNTNIRVDGSIKGILECQEKLVIGETGSIEGTITTKDAIVMGTFKGDITVNGTLHLKSSAVIQGDIIAQFLIVDEGAQYFGSCNIGSK